MFILGVKPVFKNWFHQNNEILKTLIDNEKNFLLTLISKPEKSKY